MRFGIHGFLGRRFTFRLLSNAGIMQHFVKQAVFSKALAEFLIRPSYDGIPFGGIYALCEAIS